MLDSKTPNHRLVRIQVVGHHRLDPAIAYEVAEPLHESVRVALDQHIQPQNLPGFGVRDYADDLFHAFHANRRLVRAYDFHTSARAARLFSARVSSSFLNVAP